MNILKILLIMCCAMTASADPYSTSEDQGSPEDNFRKYIADLDQLYKSGALVEYKNFDDKFLVLMSRNFPNITIATQNAKVFAKGLDFNNPLSIIEFDKRESEAYKVASQVKRMPLNPLSKESAEISKAEDRIRVARSKKIDSFAKKGYYKYFKELLTESDSVSICVNLDREALEIDGENAFTKPSEERKSILRAALEVLLAEMPIGSHSEHKFGIASYRVSCDIRISISDEALDYLNENPIVVSFSNPTVALATPLTFRTL